MLLSGGVDSSVALALLKEQGHDVTAYYMKIWLEDEMAYLGSCPWEEDLSYARRVCAQLDVPLRVVPLQKEYHRRVVHYTIDAVKKGLTPNPDIHCNAEIKFGAFIDRYGGDYDTIATGHYAQVHREEGGCVTLVRAPDPIKDQTYFLALLTQEQLHKAMFPIGHLEKKAVREMAEKFQLPTARRKDSQGICFLGKISFRDFLVHHLGIQEGVFIEKETGKELGVHDGAYLYTIGQRRGINLGGGPWYVCDKDIAQNIVYITHRYGGDDQRHDRFDVADINWICDAPKKHTLSVKLRHGPQMYQCSIVLKKTDVHRANVTLDGKDYAITPGQYAVFYDGQRCLGGGVIC